jgi:membrane-associated phospholipid phosphatase
MGAAVLGAVVLVLVVAVLVHWPPLVELDGARHERQVTWTNTHLWAVTPARLLSVAGLALVVVPVAAVAAWDQLRRGRALLGGWLVLTLVAGWLATWGLKVLVSRDRPPTNGLLWQATTSSFPSGHASVAVYGYGALAVLAWWVVREGRRGWVVAGLVLLGLGIAASRLVLAVHWTTDVVAGYLTGALVLALTTAWVVGRAPDVVAADDLSSAGSGRNR